MATRKFHLSEEAVDELKRAEKATRKSSELRRMQAVRLYGSGATVRQIVEVTRMGTRSILDCVARYRKKGINALYDYQQKGNRTLLTDDQRRDLAGKLHQYRPVDLNISQHEYWTVNDLAVVVEQWYGVVYKHTDSYIHILQQSGFSFQRSTKVYRHKPSAADIAVFESELEKK
ncbi:MAG: helix-turn-helix domain-containing protein [Chloroflexota bacterium]|nr:helix-turn-helix domain-containing protein [Chloroflexota bacterium]